MSGGEVIPLELSNPTMVLTVGAAGGCSPKEILKGGVVRKQVELVTMEPRSEMLHCPGHCQALTLKGVLGVVNTKGLLCC